MSRWTIRLTQVQLLYLDASGDPGWCPPTGRSKTRWYVLVGLSLDDRKWSTAHRGVHAIIQKHFGPKDLPCRELRYSSLTSGAPPFDHLTRNERKGLADDIFALILSLEPFLMACAVDKIDHRVRLGEEAAHPKNLTLKVIAHMYDRYLGLVGDRGMMIMDSEETRKDRKLKHLIEQTRRGGPSIQIPQANGGSDCRGDLTHIVESVVFVDSEDSPLIQLVDFCAYATWSHLERGKSWRFNEISHLFRCERLSEPGLVTWPDENNEGRERKAIIR